MGAHYQVQASKFLTAPFGSCANSTPHANHLLQADTLLPHSILHHTAPWWWLLLDLEVCTAAPVQSHACATLLAVAITPAYLAGPHVPVSRIQQRHTSCSASPPDPELTHITHNKQQYVLAVHIAFAATCVPHHKTTAGESSTFKRTLDLQLQTAANQQLKPPGSLLGAKPSHG